LALSPKSILVDATPLTLTSGGIRRYTSELSRALAEEFPAELFVLASDQPFRHTEAPPNLTTYEPAPGWRARRWWSAGLPLAIHNSGARLFHGTDFAVPYLPVAPTVMTVHDLSPWKSRDWHHAANRVRARTPILLKLGLATMVVTPSEAVRREVIDHFRLSPSRVMAVPLAAAAHFRPLEPAMPPPTPYFVYVGVLEPRKNIPLLVEAWQQVVDRRPVRLVLAGRRRADFVGLQERDGIEVLGEVDESELPGLYSGAVAMLYPSLYEGFGLPVLEAMQCGCPVVTSEDAAVGEVAGEAAIRLNSNNPRTWAETMEALLTQQELRESRRRLALDRSAQFSWQRTARETYAVYEEAEERFGS
jgi:glycosyltransferase involved in cell wall biosynthesis